MATAALNWYGSLEYLGRSFRVIAPDMRGHGRLGRGAPPFTLDGCADDIANIEDAFGVPRAIVVGYSMGGAVAQVFARRHRDRADGIVLCATAASFARRLKLRPGVRVVGGLGAAAVRKWPDAGHRFLAWRIARHDQVTAARRARGHGGLAPHSRPGRQGADGAEGAEGAAAPIARPAHPDWALRERPLADLAAFIEAGVALNAYDSNAWLPELDLPAAVVVTQRDRIVAPWRQEAMAALIPGAKRYAVDAGHDAVVSRPDAFLPTLRDACTGLRSQHPGPLAPSL
jgi:pimeloyl-ACP methyl ester carboxylesterase